MLCALFAEVLGLERVGIDDNFFALGGDSIMSIQLVSRARQAGLVITPRAVFQHQTVAALAGVATLIEETAATAMPDIAPSALLALAQGEIERLERDYPQIEDILPLSPLQEGLLFHALYDAQAPDVYIDATGARPARAARWRRRCKRRCRRCSIAMRACAPASGMRT